MAKPKFLAQTLSPEEAVGLWRFLRRVLWVQSPVWSSVGVEDERATEAQRALCTHPTLRALASLQTEVASGRPQLGPMQGSGL